LPRPPATRPLACPASPAPPRQPRTFFPAAPPARDRQTTARLPFDRRGTSVDLTCVRGRAHELRRRHRIGPSRHDPVVVHRNGPGRRRRAPSLALHLAEVGDGERLDLFPFLAHPPAFALRFVILPLYAPPKTHL